MYWEDSLEPENVSLISVSETFNDNCWREAGFSDYAVYLLKAQTTDEAWWQVTKAGI